MSFANLTETDLYVLYDSKTLDMFTHAINKIILFTLYVVMNPLL